MSLWLRGEGRGLFFALGLEDNEDDFRARKDTDGEAPCACATRDVEMRSPGKFLESVKHSVGHGNNGHEGEYLAAVGVAGKLQVEVAE